VNSVWKLQWQNIISPCRLNVRQPGEFKYKQWELRASNLKEVYQLKILYTEWEQGSKQVIKEFWRKAASHVVPLLRTELSILLRTPQQRLAMLFDWPGNLQNYPFSWGSRPYLIHVFWAHKSQSSKRISIGLAVLHSTSVWPIHRQTHRPRYVRHLYSNRPHLINWVHAMRPNNIIYQVVKRYTNQYFLHYNWKDV